VPDSQNGGGLPAQESQPTTPMSLFTFGEKNSEIRRDTSTEPQFGQVTPETSVLENLCSNF
jgi:hypothetical protein